MLWKGDGSSGPETSSVLRLNLFLYGEISMANQVGKRYVCRVCGGEVIVTRKGDGELHCCGKKMEIKK
jgi:hypothetical protein